MSEISEQAKAKAVEVVGGWTAEGLVENVARYIQDVSDAAKQVAATLDREGYSRRSHVQELLASFILPDPVDPLLIEAREIAANEVVHGDDFHWRHTEAVAIALAALKRGMELAKGNQS